MRLRRFAVVAVLTVVNALVGCESEGDSIGERGGVVTSDDGRLTLEIPEGALDSEIEIEIAIEPSAQGDAMSATYRLEPAGLAFEVPATITYELEPGEMAEMRGREVVVVAESDTGWTALADRFVDGQETFVSSSMLYLSSVVVVAR